MEKSSPEWYAERAWSNLSLALPVDLSVILERVGATLIEEPEHADICGAFVITPEGNRVISVNSRLGVGRRRFTTSHEIFHCVTTPKNTPPGTICRLRVLTGQPRPEEEILADRFAAHLLMPENLVQQHWTELSANVPYRMQIMCERFGVSRKAMTVQLRRLGLVFSRGDHTRPVQPPWFTGKRHEGSWI